VAAHDHLDELVDHSFGAKRTCASEAERQQVLFARYEELAALLTAASTRRRR